ncbi:MAG: helix-turn-helix domain-containing protein [Acidobacteriota bacterium]|nr:helix-turn-helix domain-containing protein [Acidobacteriota bacterium]
MHVARRKNLSRRPEAGPATPASIPGAKVSPAEGRPQREVDIQADVLRSYLRTLTQAFEILLLRHAAEEFTHASLADGLDFYEEVRRFEVRLIKAALSYAGGSQARAAKLLRLRGSTLNMMISRYKIDKASD